MWDASTGNIVLIPTLEIDPTEKKLPARKKIPDLFTTNNQRVDALMWSSNGTRLAAALGNDTMYIWSIATGDIILYIFDQPGEVNTLTWSPNGSSIAAVSGNISVQVRSATTGGLFFTYSGHTQAVLSLAWSPDGKQIASAGADGLVQVWDAATGRTLFSYRGHSGEVNAVAWQKGPLPLSGHGARIASGGSDATVQVWSFGKTKQTKPTKYRQAMALQGTILLYRGHSGPVTSVTWSADGQHIASGSADGTVQVWRAK